jgi:hypothetical protein
MNSSQNHTLAITNRFQISMGKEVKKSIFNLGLALFFLLTLQSCSTIESVFDGSIFSDSPSSGAAEVKSEDKGELDGETSAVKNEEIKDLKASSQSPVKPLKQTARATTASQSTPATVPSSIEIMWQVPTEPVEAYHIYLLSGAMEQVDAAKHFRVLVSALKKEDDPTYGPVYKYQVPGNVTANTIQIKAENRFGLSEPSEPMIVQK